MIHKRHGCVRAHLYDSAFWSSRNALAEAEDDDRYIHALCFLMRIFEFVVLFIFSVHDRRHGCVRAHLQDSPTTWLRLLRITTYLLRFRCVVASLVLRRHRRWLHLRNLRLRWRYCLLIASLSHFVYLSAPRNFAASISRVNTHLMQIHAVSLRVSSAYACHIS